MHLPTECGTEVCRFRLLEDIITNARNEYIKDVLDGLIWSNSTARQLLIEVLLINNIDSQLAQLLQHPLVSDTKDFMEHLYRTAAAPFHLPSHVRRDDGGMYLYWCLFLHYAWTLCVYLLALLYKWYAAINETPFAYWRSELKHVAGLN